MGNKVAILDKLKRNLDMRSISYVDSGSFIVVDTDWTISYEDASIQKPMGGIDDSSSPFLGIGIGNPGKIKIVDSANLLNVMIDSEVKQIVFAFVCSFANDKLLVDSGANERVVPGHSDFNGLGQ